MKAQAQVTVCDHFRLVKYGDFTEETETRVQRLFHFLPPENR